MVPPATSICSAALRGGAAGTGLEAQNLVDILADPSALCAESCELGRHCSSGY
jgi:hypothetical protein